MFCIAIVTFSKRAFCFIYLDPLLRWTCTLEFSQYSGGSVDSLTCWCMFEVRCIRTLWCLNYIEKIKNNVGSIGALPYAPCCLFDVATVRSNVWPQIALCLSLPDAAECFRLRWLLQLAALQGGLSFNVGSCDYNRRLWKGSTSFIVSWTAAWHSEHTGCKCGSRWRKLQHPRHRCPNLHQAKPIVHSVPKVLLLNYYKKGNSFLPSFWQC